MLVGVIPMFFFLDFEDLWRKSQKGGKLENLGIIGLLRCSVGNPRYGEAEVPKWHPLGTSRLSKATSRQRLASQRSSATPRRSYYSQRAFF